MIGIPKYKSKSYFKAIVINKNKRSKSSRSLDGYESTENDYANSIALLKSILDKTDYEIIYNPNKLKELYINIHRNMYFENQHPELFPRYSKGTKDVIKRFLGIFHKLLRLKIIEHLGVYYLKEFDPEEKESWFDFILKNKQSLSKEDLRLLGKYRGLLQALYEHYDYGATGVNWRDPTQKKEYELKLKQIKAEIDIFLLKYYNNLILPFRDEIEYRVSLVEEEVEEWGETLGEREVSITEMWTSYEEKLRNFQNKEIIDLFNRIKHFEHFHGSIIGERMNIYGWRNWKRLADQLSENPFKLKNTLSYVINS